MAAKRRRGLPKAVATKKGNGRTRVRYAVAGLGWIAQSAVLPAFAGARKNSELVALVSDDPEKLRVLGRKYRVGKLYSYDEFDRCLGDEDVDAVFIALPNTLHRHYTEVSARAGKHVLCEKPMAMTAEDCQSMIDACRSAGVKLMIGYRLHFEKANLEAIEVAQSGKLGEPRLFNSVFTQDVAEGNVRLKEGEGGPAYDIGIYCLNAARSLFRAEPEEVSAIHVSREDDDRFLNTPEMTSVLLRFPGDRTAAFQCSFGAAPVGSYDLVGTRGSLCMNPAFEIAEDLVQYLTVGDKTRTRVYPARDQFAPELLEFSDCILSDREPEPSGEEGLADVRVLEAIEESARQGGRPVRLARFEKEQRPSLKQEIQRPLPPKPELVRVEPPSA